jgi:hypothetical protein
MTKTNETETTASRTGYFAELLSLEESQIDAEGFVVRGVTLIKPGFSTNTDKAGRARYYPAETLRKAAGVFEGTRAYLNHPSRSQSNDLPERDVRDIAGYYENVRAADDGRLVGDMRIVGQARETIWPLIAEAATRKPGLVGLSINALGVTRLGDHDGRKAVVVESIPAANSVDIVTTPAAGGGFAGALLASDGEAFTRQLLDNLTFDEWREARADYVTKLKAEWKTLRETDALKEARANVETATAALAALQEQHRAEGDELAGYRRAALADRLLEGSGVPHKLRAAVREDMLAEADEDGMAQVLEREKAKIAARTPAPVPVSGAGQRVTTAQGRTAPRPADPVGQIMGISESMRPLPNETAEDYRRRKLAAAQ